MRSTYAEIRAAYVSMNEDEASSRIRAVVGSPFGGVVSNFMEDKVSQIFVGATAG